MIFQVNVHHGSALLTKFNWNFTVKSDCEKINEHKELKYGKYPFMILSKKSLLDCSSYERKSPSLMENPWRHSFNVTGSMFVGRLGRDNCSGSVT